MTKTATRNGGFQVKVLPLWKEKVTRLTVILIVAIVGAILLLGGNKPGLSYEPRPEKGDHTTDRVYKMLYACPADTSSFDWLDEIKEVGFNTIHTYSPYQWEQEGWWEGEGHDECLCSIRILLEELANRNMYGCLQVPLGPEGSRQNLKDTINLMKHYPNAIVGTVEEPDLHIPSSPTPTEQKEIYNIIKSIAPNLPVWGCFNGGDWSKAMNVNAYDLIMTDSYAYSIQDGSRPVPGTLADRSGTDNKGLPWWSISRFIVQEKIPMIRESLPPDMPVINIQQGFYDDGNPLPNIEEEWNLYHKELGLNSFAVYAHGQGQSTNATHVLQDDRPESYSIKNQVREFMKKLDGR